ncbi:polyprotein [Arracacha virus A]|uniref:RNA1 polyprotein n=1 Tax=Arracacha virus A TaxID=1964552 RepID=A0A1S6R4Q0_9SECO|nr:polyprotein [Arracacha virus A]AQW44800.1 polyprotein [Arracacha virus A]
MGWSCPVKGCLQSELSNREFREECGRAGRCPRCDALMMRVDSAPASQRKSSDSAEPKIKCLCWRLPISRCPKHKGISPSFSSPSPLPKSSLPPSGIVQKFEKEEAPLPRASLCDAVVFTGPPVNLELVYPSLVDQTPSPKIQRAPVRPKVVSEGSAVPLSAALAPEWLKREPVKVRPTTTKVEKSPFPKGAHHYDGVNYRSKSGKIILSAAAKKLLAGAIKLHKQKLRSARRAAACRRVRMARYKEEYALLSKTLTWESIGSFAYALPPSHGCMGRSATRKVDPSLLRRKLKKRVKAVTPQPIAQEWTPEVEALVSQFIAERNESLVFDDEDCVFVDVPRPALPPREKVGRIPVVETVPQAIASLEAFWNTGCFTPAIKSRVQELWDSSSCDLVEIGRFCAYLTELGDPEIAPLFEINFFALSAEEQTQLADINAALLDECISLEGLATIARANMFQFVKETASGLASVVKTGIHSVASKILESTSSGFDAVTTFVTDCVRKIFDKILGPWLAPFKHLTEQINALWTKIKSWVQKIKESMPLALRVMEEHALFAFSAMVVGGVVVLVETTLQSLGVINKVGATLGLFLTLFLTSLGLSGILACTEQIAELHRAFKVGVCCMVRPNTNNSQNLDVPGTENVAEARSLVGLDNAIAALTGFGKTLVSFKLGTLSYYAKMGQSFDQLARGKKAIQELGAWTIDIIGTIYNKLTGRCSQFFDELSALVCCDVRMWLRSSQRVRLDALITPGSRNVLEIVEKLLETGQKLKIGASGVARKFSLDFTNTIAKEVEKLEEVRNQLANAGAYKGTRFYPFWVYVVGDSQCGKTNVVSQYLAPGLLDKLDCALDSQYSKGKQDAYWSDYKRQALVKVDDMFAIKTAEIEPMMIDMVNSEPFPLNMAALADKGRLFDSPLVITTCNDLHPPSDCDLRDKPSFYNRRAVVLEMRRKEGSVYNPADTNDCSECRLLNPKVSQVNGKDEALHQALTDWISVKDATARIETLLLEHKVREEIRINAVNEAQRGQTGIMCFSKQYIMEQRLQGVFLDEPTKSRYELTSKCFMFLVVDGVVYQQDAAGHVFPLDHQPKIPEAELKKMEDRCVANVVYNIQAYLADGPPNGLVGTFLAHIIDETCNVKSVAKLSSSATAGELEFWESLECDLRGRVYLRLCQKRKDSIAGETRDSALDKSVEKLCSLVGDSYQYVRAHGGTLCLLLAGFVTMTISFYGLFSFMTHFFSAPSITTGIVALEAIEAKAVMSSSSYGDAYGKRNVRPLHEYTARSAFEGESKELWQRLCVKIFPEAGPSKGKLVLSCQFEGRSLLLTRHQAQSIPHGSQVFVEYTDLPGVYLFWDHDRLLTFDDRELVLYRDAALHQLPSKSKKFFLLDDETRLAPTMLVSRFGYRFDGISGQVADVRRERLTASTVRETLAVRRTNGGYTYERILNKFIRVDGLAQDDDCGTLVATLIGGQPRIVGMLVGGSGNTFCADIIPQFHEAEARGSVRINQEFGIQEPGYAKLGYLDNSQRPTMPTKTQYVRVPEEFCISVPECKEPAILCKDDPRLAAMGKQYDPLRDGLKKYAQPMGRLEEPLLKEVAADIVNTWYDCQEGFLEDVSLDVAINGDDVEDFFDPMVMSTSEGYPFVLERKNGERGKERYFEGLPRERELKSGTTVEVAYLDLCSVAPHAVPELWCMECPKDERLPSRKIQNPKTRLFAILPLHFNLRLRVKYLAFARFIMKNRSRLACQVGINPYSREWKELYARLAHVSSEAYNCDYSSFDGLMTHQVLNTIADMINLMFSADEEPSSKAERKNLMMAIWGRRCIAGSQVYQVNAGIPSGCALTVLLNSIFNELLVRYAYKKFVPGIAREQFSTQVCLLVYGDDNLIAVKQGISQFTIKSDGEDKVVSFGKLLKDTLAGVGVTITDGTDKLSPTLEPKPLESLDFLKRGFKKKDGYILAPLDKNAIYSSLVWVASRDEDVMEKLRLNVNVALQEIWLWQDVQEFNKLRNFYVSAIPSWSGLPTWNAIKAFHVEQLTHTKPWQPAKNIDILVRPEMFSFIDCHGYADEKFVVCEGIFVAGPKYRFEPGEFGVSLTNLLKGEDSLNCVFVKQESDLPSATWVQSFGSPLNPCVARMRAAHSAGKKLVFRGHAPYMACWLAMMKFCISAGICDQDSLLALFYNLKGNKQTDLSSYFSKFDREKRMGHRILPRPIHFATTNSKKLEQSDSIFHGVVQVDISCRELDDQPSVKLVIGDKALKLKEKSRVFPLLVEDTGFSILSEGEEPGARIKHVLQHEPGFWEQHKGKCAVVTSYAALYCDAKCPGHIHGKSSGCRIIDSQDMYRDDLHGFEKFITFDGMYADDSKLKLSKANPRLAVFDHLKRSNCFRIK